MSKGGQAQKQKGMGRFTRARTYVCMQFKGTGGMIHDILKLHVVPNWVGTYYDIEDTAIYVQGMRGVRKQRQQ